MRTLSLALALALLLPAVAGASQAPDADSREVSAYQLTEPGLGKFAQATRGLMALQADECGDDADVKTISEAVARLDAMPGAKAAIESAGMSTREYIVFSFAMMQSGLAAWGLDQPGGKLPPGVSAANVEFYRKHAVELQRLAEETEDSTCAAEESEDGE
jgi:hypothetical protein